MYLLHFRILAPKMKNNIGTGISAIDTNPRTQVAHFTPIYSTEVSAHFRFNNGKAFDIRTPLYMCKANIGNAAPNSERGMVLPAIAELANIMYTSMM